jgi:hypothetical protein
MNKEKNYFRHLGLLFLFFFSLPIVALDDSRPDSSGNDRLIEIAPGQSKWT